MAEETMRTDSEEELQELGIALKERVSKLMEDESFLGTLVGLEEPEDVQKLFAEHGVGMTIEQVHALGRLIERAIENGGELSEDELEEVSGGAGVFAAISAVSSSAVFATTAEVVLPMAGVVGIAVAATIAVGVAAYFIAKNARRIANWFRRW